MKKLSFAACALSALTLASCGGSSSSEDAKEKAVDSVKVFAVDVATKVSKGQKDSVVMVYADAAKADSLVLSIVPDSVKVIEIDSVTFSADLGGGKTIGIKKDAQGKLAVTESKGLFAYPEKDLDFAKKTGMWADSLTDAQFAERMATKEEFRKYLISTFTAPTPLTITSKTSTERGEPLTWDYVKTLKYTVKNTSNQPISGDEYSFMIKGYNVPANPMFADLTNPWNESLKGKSLAPNESHTFTHEISWYDEVESAKIVYSLNKTQQFEKYFEPKGDEYQKFLNSKKK